MVSRGFWRKWSCGRSQKKISIFQNIKVNYFDKKDINSESTKGLFIKGIVGKVVFLVVHIEWCLRNTICMNTFT